MTKIAVVGSGIAGLSAAWLLSKKYEVHLFEKEPRLGGHTYTLQISDGQKEIPVDCGFLVHNVKTYPHLIQLFKHLEIETYPTEMSLSIQVKEKKLEWCGTDLKTVLLNPKTFFNFRYWKMLYSIIQFHKNKHIYLKQCQKHEWSLRDFFRVYKFNPDFIEWYLLPMGGCIWSCSMEQMLDFPAYTFLNFCENHGLLQVSDRPQWKTIPGGNSTYIQKMKTAISKIHTGNPVLGCRRFEDHVELTTSEGIQKFDYVVFASHTPETKNIIKDPSEDEKAVLNNIKYQKNSIYIHHDESLMPSIKRHWSSWNFITERLSDSKRICVTYWINRLQPLKTDKNFFVTLNPPKKPNHVTHEFEFEHPLLDQKALNAQKLLSQIQGRQRTYYTGAWCGHGFHEDGLLASVKVCELLGVKTPWEAIST